MTDRMLRDAFERIADRAEPVPDLAERALRTAARRRNARLAAVAAGMAMVAVAPFAVAAFDGSPQRQGPVSGRPEVVLPSDDAAGRAVVRACLRGGSPVGTMSQRRAEYGKPADYRLLTSLRVGEETVAMVGGERGFVLCSRSGSGGNMEPPMFRPWPGTRDKGLWAFRPPARIDAVGSVPTRELMDLHHVVAGRVKPGVTRVTVAWDRDRTAEAAVRNGFFIARIDGAIVPTNGDEDDMGGSASDREERVMGLTAFGADGRAVYRFNAGGITAFHSGDCGAPLQIGRLLCTDDPDTGFTPR